MAQVVRHISCLRRNAGRLITRNGMENVAKKASVQAWSEGGQVSEPKAKRFFMHTS